MATSKAKPTDTTGRQREQLIQDNAEAVQDAATQMAMATAQAQDSFNNDVIDATVPNKPTIIVDEPTIVSDEGKVITIRVVEDIENMTFGAGNYFSFRAGQKYQVTQDLARHLEEKGYLAGSL
jgi:hypothetical protein